ncbi:metallopeptidase family protein [Candidatus Gottesmanbacteria bacterium]|nr:metallopeptidase family protein [Candidatus Gottesmanbacteria bacterium]
MLLIIHDTVLHEIGHHFGMSEEMIRKAEIRNKIGI